MVQQLQTYLTAPSRMTTLRAIARATVVFGVVGPAIGALTIWLQRPPTGFRNVLLLSYVFGGIPALIAGVAYGRVRARRSSPSRWYVGALLGAGAGLVGCLVFFLFVSVYDLLTISERTVRELDIGFLRQLLLAGIPAGTVRALLIEIGELFVTVRPSRG